MRSFIDMLDHSYKPSSCTHCSRVLIPAKYEVVKQKVVEALIDVDLCSFMSNWWTDCHNQVYISLTVQFAASSMEMKNFCLMTKNFQKLTLLKTWLKYYYKLLRNGNLLVKFMDLVPIMK